MDAGREQDGSEHSKDCASQVHVCWTRSREIRYRLYHRLHGHYAPAGSSSGGAGVPKGRVADYTDKSHYLSSPRHVHLKHSGRVPCTGAAVRFND
jgi:hypothetical protein